MWFGGYLMPISDLGGRVAQRRIAALVNPAGEALSTEPAAATDPPTSKSTPEPETPAAEAANRDS